jgi:hypothetical protein
MNKEQLINKVCEEIAKNMVDEGRLIEGGWRMFRVMSLPVNMPDSDYKTARLLFFAGAQHLYASIMGILEQGDEPTEKGMGRMQKIHDELEAFRLELAQRDRPRL